MNCPHCHSPKTQKDGQRQLHTGQRVQGYRCAACKKRFNERTGTPMSRLRTPQAVVETALKARSEGLGVRATARVLDKSHNSISKWESRTGNSFFYEYSHVDSGCFENFLEQFSFAYSEGIHIIQLDNARSHTAKNLSLPENVYLTVF